MKKITAFIIGLLLIFTTSGCSLKPNEGNQNVSDTPQSEISSQDKVSQKEVSEIEISSNETSKLSSNQSSSSTVSSSKPIAKPPASSKPIVKKPIPPSSKASSKPIAKPPVSSKPKPPQTTSTINPTLTAAQQRQIEDEIFKQVNLLRKSKGVAPFKRSALLDKSASIRSNEMLKTQKFDHVRPDGSGFHTTIKEVGYKYFICGENIAYLNGYPISKIANQMMNGWINSKPHYLAMIDGAANAPNNEYEHIGISVAYKNGIAYGTQHFGKEM